MGELARRLVHVAGAGFPGLYLADQAFGIGADWETVRLLLLVATGIAALVEAVRLTGRLPESVRRTVFDPLVRSYEQTNVAGYALFLVGMTVTVYLVPRTAAIPALLMLAIVDPLSGMLSAGEVTKQAHILLFTFGACTLLALPFVSSGPAIAGAAVATAADGYKPVIRTYVIDDNLTIPIGAGLAIAGVTWALNSGV